VKPLLLNLQEKVHNDSLQNYQGPRTITDAKEGLDIELNFSNTLLGTQTITRMRENTDNDFGDTKDIVY
jgi:hypothetical protein